MGRWSVGRVHTAGPHFLPVLAGPAPQERERCPEAGPDAPRVPGARGLEVPKG